MRDAERDDPFVALDLALGEAKQPGRGPHAQDQQTRGHGIERAGVTHALFVQDASDVTHHVVAGHPGGLSIRRSPLLVIVTLAAQELVDGFGTRDRGVDHEGQFRRALQARLGIHRRLYLARRSSRASFAWSETESKYTFAWRRSGDVSTPVTVKKPRRSSMSEIRRSSSEMTSRKIWFTRAERG